MRKPKSTGTFYESNEPALKRQIKACFEGERGPGSLPTKDRNDSIKGMIVPHAGYEYSGQCAAWGYKALGETEMTDVYILLGPSHQKAKSGLSFETYETPLGMVRCHQPLARKLVEKGHIEQNEELFEDEHSLEVQLPFLQFVNTSETLKILPILISHDVNMKQLAIDIKESLIEMNLNAVFIVSSDFTHHGPNYRYIPFSEDVDKKIYDFDGKAIEFIKAKDIIGLAKYVDENMSTICGTFPIMLYLMITDADKITLEQFYTSGDVMGNYKNSVSYASILFR